MPIFGVFNTYGHGQSAKYEGVITKFARRVLDNKPPEIYGDGEQTRDFVHVEDIVEVIKLVVKRNITGTFSTEMGKPIKIWKLIIAAAGKNLRPIFSDSRPSDIKHSYAKVKRTVEVLKSS